jgi:hypothetical protein
VTVRRQSIERLLPQAYQQVAEPPGVLAALLAAMERMHEPSERVLAAVDDLFTAYRSPDRMVGFLLGWVALDHVPNPSGVPGVPGVPGAPRSSAVSQGRLRDLLAQGAWLAQRRGTAAGLGALIETVIGIPVAIEEPTDRPFHVVVRLPAAAAHHRALVCRVVEAEKPAATTSEVVVEGEEPPEPPELAEPAEPADLAEPAELAELADPAELAELAEPAGEVLAGEEKGPAPLRDDIVEKEPPEGVVVDDHSRVETEHGQEVVTEHRQGEESQA